MMQACTTVWGHTLVTASGRPLRPSQTRKNTSFTPRLRRSSSAITGLGQLGAQPLAAAWLPARRRHVPTYTGSPIDLRE